MAPSDPASGWYPLRSVTRRLACTPVAQLPYLVPSLARTISTCGEVLSSIDEQSQKKAQSEVAVLVHQLGTQISTLLQDRTKEARWSAVVLVKATIEAGGWSILQGSAKWVRALLGLIGVSQSQQCLNLIEGAHEYFLQRPEPSTTKKLSIIVITRIFLLTQSHQSLIRELTTPSLPTFFTACLKLVEDSKGVDTRRPVVNDSLLSTLLWAFGELLPHHPTASRPFVGQIRALVLPLIAPTASSFQSDGSNGVSCSQITALRARHVFVLLGGCAAKNNQGQEWAQSLSTVIDLSHRTADSVFRALDEDWESTDQRSTGPVPTTEILGFHESESGLPGWQGISAGIERLDGLLRTVQAHLEYATAAAVTIPIDKVMSLVDRMLSALPPANGKGTRTNPEIGRDEREMLWTSLPKFHIAAMQILYNLILRLKDGPMALVYRLLDYVLWIFEHEHSQVQIRITVYTVVASLLPCCRSAIPRTVASSLEQCIRACCKDLLPTQQSPTSSVHDAGTRKIEVAKSSTNAEAYSKTAGSSPAPSNGSSELFRSAEHMLSMALTHLPSNFLRLPLRSKIDQTAILVQSSVILRSSVLNTPNYHKGQRESSVIPLLARQYPQDQGTEGLARPRLPLVQRSLDHEFIDLAQDIEGQKSVSPERDQPLSPNLDLLPNSHSQEGTKFMNIQEQASLNSEVPFAEDPPSEPRATVEPFSEMQGEGIFTMPTKRSRESDPDNRHEIAQNGSRHVLDPITEPASKRLREGSGDIYISPATEDDLPPAVAMDPQDDHNLRSTQLAASSEPLNSLRTTREDMDDDSSDDSSIPPMDLTLATDDEEEEGEDNGE